MASGLEMLLKSFGFNVEDVKAQAGQLQQIAVSIDARLATIVDLQVKTLIGLEIIGEKHGIQNIGQEILRRRNEAAARVDGGRTLERS